MSKGRKPKNKHTLTFHFDSKVGVENFMAWYHNSGEQDINYYTEAWGKDWMYVQPPEDACPECEFTDDDIQNKCFEDKTVKSFTWTCMNCDHQFTIKNQY